MSRQKHLCITRSCYPFNPLPLFYQPIVLIYIAVSRFVIHLAVLEDLFKEGILAFMTSTFKICIIKFCRGSHLSGVAYSDEIKLFPNEQCGEINLKKRTRKLNLNSPYSS